MLQYHVGDSLMQPEKQPVTIQELWISKVASMDALAEQLIEKSLLAQQEFLQKSTEDRATFQRTLKPTPH